MAAIVDFEFAASPELLVHLHKIFKVASLALSNLTCKLSCQVKQTTSFLNISFLTCCITAPPSYVKDPAQWSIVNMLLPTYYYMYYYCYFSKSGGNVYVDLCADFILGYRIFSYLHHTNSIHMLRMVCNELRLICVL